MAGAGISSRLISLSASALVAAVREKANEAARPKAAMRNAPRAAISVFGRIRTTLRSSRAPRIRSGYPIGAPKLQNLRIVRAEKRFGSQADASDVPA
ncbi:hypothetical protein GCM10023067_06540 [Aminobacter aganoensis]